MLNLNILIIVVNVMYFHARLLSNMGVKEGFDPRIKIAQCRVWRNEELK
ncbi:MULTISPECIES: hypothetical protein [Erysipelotrichaceae]|uniref:Uncharacterized protein n=1 Tax=Amedibacillus hominis TaxID=2897776 RepID=A0ABS9RCQ6_9FIRM|nr:MULTISPECIES: hypothetical protein [Erysipelotrichaceae]MCH4287430.1 hypothetical protein [Amedibacillus hominis]